MKLNRLIALALIFTASILPSSVLGKGGEIKFASTVVSVSQTDTSVGTIEVTIHDVVVAVMINGDTEITEAGEEISLGDLSSGTYVRIDSFFSDEVIVADEVKVIDQRDEQFSDSEEKLTLLIL